MAQHELLTILFTDIVGSTLILDAEGQRASRLVFRRHRQLLGSMVTSHGGTMDQWLGDGMMAVFPEPGAAIAAGIAIQRRLQMLPGEELEVRVGLTTGTVDIDDDGVYFGTPLVVARRLCDSADGGEIRCTDVVRALLPGMTDESFAALGPVELKGLATPIDAFSVVYDRPSARDYRNSSLFVGRDQELAALGDALLQADSGEPTLVVVEGEAGVGKTRLVSAFLDDLDHGTTAVGRCLDGDVGGAHSGLSRAVDELVAGSAAPDLDRPALHGVVESLATSVPALVPFVVEDGARRASPRNVTEKGLQMVEDLRTLLAQLVTRQPLILVLDDLHLADDETIGLLHGLLLRLDSMPVLVIATMRTGELAADHPLVASLDELSRRVMPVRIEMRGLDEASTHDLVERLLAAPVAPGESASLHRRTGGNPFYLQELLAESGGGAPETPVDNIVPRNVRDLVRRRVGRLDDHATEMLRHAAVLVGPFPFEPVVEATGLDLSNGLDAMDALLHSGLVRPAVTETYEFAHDLTRQSVLEMSSDARARRIERRMADALGALDTAARRPWLATIARLYHRSRALGDVPTWPLTEALHEARRAHAFLAQAELARMALDVGGMADDERLELAKLEAMALVAAIDRRAIDLVLAVADSLLDAGRADEAIEFLADGVIGVRKSGFVSEDIRRIAVEADGRTGPELSVPGAVIRRFRLILEPESSDYPGVLNFDRADEINALLATQSDEQLERWDSAPPPGPTRVEALQDRDPEVRLYYAGDFVGTKDEFATQAERSLEVGRVRDAIASYASRARACIALGEFAEAEGSLAQAEELQGRLPDASDVVLHVGGAREDLRRALGRPPDQGLLDYLQEFVANAPETWALAAVRATLASALAEVDDRDGARAALETLIRPIELSRGDQVTYLHVVWHAVEACYAIGASDLVPMLRVNVEQKILEPDFRAAMVDSRMALGRLAVVEGDHRDAIRWYELATEVLSSARARPLAAIARLETAQVLLAQGQPPDATEVRGLLDAALGEFQSLGMHGWVQRAAQTSGRTLAFRPLEG